MKNLMKNVLILFSIMLVISSCDDKELAVLNPTASSTLNLSTTDVVLDKDNAAQDAFTLTWSKPEYGFNASTDYKIVFLYGDASENVSVGNVLSKTFKTEELNKLLLKLGLEGGVASDILVQVNAVLSSTSSITSNATTFMATIYEDQLDLSSTWGVVGSGFNNWGATPDAPFYTTETPNVLVCYATLVDGEIKVRENNEWDNAYGDANLDGVLDTDDDNNITVTAGNYKITMNTSTLEYSIEAYSWGLVGSAYNDWGATPDALMEYDPFTNQWKAIVTLLDGDLKFRNNNEWNIAYGDANLDGVLDTDDDNNIAVTAGNYLVTANFETFEYSIEPIDIWGAVGSAVNDWGATPDAKFTRDWEFDDVWVLNDVTFIDGDIKFRLNDKWDTAYGDANLDGTLDMDDDNNIAVTAGVYNVTLNFSNADAPTYTITAQ